ncbi:hypothetical protein [Brachyspira pilosicoli]|uniref:FecR protein domain-containing protein n=1 Tax=Brachyspira pilosicoli TaxID=52584 RepID=A0A5C8EHY3_BRAPL|nr:hypothetical protein [Brachyspira pilosicoli]TXJ37365.1 hypothetical protein EPJ72_10990 [Brachyspira pilosicoli]
MKITTVFLLNIFILFSSNMLFSQDITFRITGISGVAFIEKSDKSLRVFRGSEIHEGYKLSTESNTTVEITVLKNGNNIGNISLNERSIMMVNSISAEGSYISLSLLYGYFTVNIEDEYQVHTANVSSMVTYNNTPAKVEVAFSEDGSTIVIPINTKVNIYTDNDERTINPREVYIANFDGNNKVVKQGSDTDPLVFLNKGEENARLDSTSTIESLISAMEDISQNDITAVSRVSFTDVDNSEKDIHALEMKKNRMIAGNEGYYSSIVRLINLDSVSKNEMIPYARKSLGLYSANQRAISKMNSALTRTRDKFNRIKRDFDSKMHGASK